MHRLRLTNNGKYPLTTAPALIVQGNRPRPGHDEVHGGVSHQRSGCDHGGGISSSRKDVEAGRTPGAVKWYGVELTKVDMAGTIKLNNRAREAVQVEVVRHVLGHVDQPSRMARRCRSRRRMRGGRGGSTGVVAVLRMAVVLERCERRGRGPLEATLEPAARRS
jgi:hypothetical protein